MSIDYDFWQALWDKHREEYLADCRQYNIQAGLSDFQVWADEHNLVPEYDVL